MLPKTEALADAIAARHTAFFLSQAGKLGHITFSSPFWDIWGVSSMALVETR